MGAHRAHLVDGPFRKAVECASCHLVPTSAGPHKPASVVFFSRLSTTAWAGSHLTPTYASGTCSGTYCHGNFKNGANATPTWTAAGSVACGSCHAVSLTNGPGGTHPDITAQAGTCGLCHPGYTATSVNLTLHLNGKVDGGGHPPGWKEPDPHGVAALSFTTGDNGHATSDKHREINERARVSGQNELRDFIRCQCREAPKHNSESRTARIPYRS